MVRFHSLTDAFDEGRDGGTHTFLTENGAAVAAHDDEAESLGLGILDDGDVGVGNVEIFAADVAGLSIGSSHCAD